MAVVHAGGQQHAACRLARSVRELEHEWIYVLDGRLRLLLGDDDFTIAAGEAVEFSTFRPHWFGAIDGPVELIAIFGPHGERLHLHG